jgi:hypothetical protein
MPVGVATFTVDVGLEVTPANAEAIAHVLGLPFGEAGKEGS